MPRVSGPFPALCAHRPRSLTTRRLCAPSPPSARGPRVCAQSHVAPEPLPAAAAGPPSLPSPRPLTTAWDALHFLSWPVSLARLSAPRQGLWPPVVPGTPQLPRTGLAQSGSRQDRRHARRSGRLGAAAGRPQAAAWTLPDRATPSLPGARRRGRSACQRASQLWDDCPSPSGGV